MSEGQQFRKRKIINWPQYNRALIERGSLTFWFEDGIERWWYARKTGPTGRGLDKTFSDEALVLCLLVRLHYKLTLRSMEGFVNSVFQLLGLPLRCPGYTLFSKQRGKDLEVPIPRHIGAGALDIVVDSTGLKVYGEGEWKVRKHGVGKRRTWRKLHLGIDPNSHEVVMVELTEETVNDGEQLPALLEQVDGHALGEVIGDGAYDQARCYDAVHERGGTARFPPRRGSVPWAAEHPRTQAVLACAGEESRTLWKHEVNYHRRSLAETGMYRYKQLIGARMRARIFETQRVEAYTGVAVLNRLRALGMPKRH
jgi:hypothetical protein